MPTVDDIRQSLRKVIDPELNLNIVDLGLVYGIELKEDNTVKVDMSLTSPMCPFGPQIMSDVPKAIKSDYSEIEKTDVNLVWIPQWDPRTMASDEIKMELGIFDFDDDDDDDDDEAYS